MRTARLWAQTARPVVAVDSDGRILWANKILQDRCGITDVTSGLCGLSVKALGDNHQNLAGFEGPVTISSSPDSLAYVTNLSFTDSPDGDGVFTGIGDQTQATLLACRIDSSGMIKGMSAYLGSLIGWRSEDSGQRSLQGLFHQEDWPRISVMLGEAALGETGECVVSGRLLSTASREFWAEVRVVVPDEKQIVLDRLFSATPDPISLLSRDAAGEWRVDIANEAFCAASCISLAGLRGRTARQVFGEVDGSQIERSCEAVTELAEPCEIAEHITISGTTWNLKLLPLTNGVDQVRRVGCIGRDISTCIALDRERVRAEMLNSALQLQSELISRTTKDGQFLFANEACCRFFGRTLEELRSSRWEPTVVMEEDRASVLEASGKLSPKFPEQTIEFRSYNAAGQIRWMDYKIVGTFDANGELSDVLSVGRDVTERKEMEARLAEVSARLIQTVDLSPCILSRFNQEYRLMEISPACKSILGYEPDELLGASAELIVYPDDLQIVDTALRRLAEGGPPVDARYRARAKDGSWVWLASHARLLQGEIHVASADVTQRMNAQQALQAERQFLTTLFEITSQGVVYRNEEGEVERANPAAERILGLSKEQLLGRTSVDPRWHSIREDGSPFPGEEHPAMIALRTGKSVADVLMGLYNPAEGTTRWISMNAIPRFEAGTTEPSGVYTVFNDITRMREAMLALERSEEILRLALDASNSALWYWDIECRTGFTSAKYPQLLGLQPSDMEHWEDKLFRYIHPDDAAAVQNEVQRCFEGRQSSFSLIHRMLHASGRVIWVSAAGMVLEEKSPGGGRRLAGTIRDITELVEARQVAERYAERRRDFLANMSHEIRTPMNGIIGLAAVLADTEMTAEQRHLVANIQTCGDSLLSLVNDILDLSKVEAGKLRLERVEFEPAVLAEEALSVVRRNAAAKGLRLQVAISKAVPLFVTGDPNRLRQVLVNLLSNAVKFTGRGGIDLSIDCVRPAQNLTLSVEVRDTGIGMTADQQARVFGAFEQAERHTARLFGGTGLGLAISRMLVELMGGTIEVESRFNEGSTFRFTAVLEPVADRRPDDGATSPATIVFLRTANTSEHTIRRRQLESARITVHSSRQRTCDVILLAPERSDEAKQWIEELSQNEALRDKPFLVITPVDIGSADSRTFEILGQIQWLPRPVGCGPLVEAVSKAHGGSNKHREPKQGVRERWQGKRVLVAEDNLINQLVTGKMLERLGCIVTFASDGQEAVDQVQCGTPFDLLLMDCQMPHVDGLEATRLIRSLDGESRTIPIVALSAGVLAEERQACVQCGMDAFLAKPISIAELRNVLDTYLPVAEMNDRST